MSLIDLIFPKFCLECRNAGKYICRNCAGKVRLIMEYCPICHRDSEGGFVHPQCISDTGLERLISVWQFKGVVRKAILAFKYKFASQVAEELNYYFILNLKNENLVTEGKTVVEPIPLYWYRENERGFNQSAFFARQLASHLHSEFIKDLLIKSKQSHPQVGLKGQQRTANVHGLFSVNRTYWEKLENFKRVILVDDVYTTGSTINEAVKVLRKGGVKSIWGITLARQI